MFVVELFSVYDLREHYNNGHFHSFMSEKAFSPFNSSINGFEYSPISPEMHHNKCLLGYMQKGIFTSTWH